MKILYITIFAASLALFNDIAKINKLKSEAQRSYEAGDFKSALHHYQILVDSFQLQEEEVLMNYANAAYLLTNPTGGEMKGITPDAGNIPDLPEEEMAKYLETARNQYTQLSQTAAFSNQMKSLAYNQLGVMNYQMGAVQGAQALQVAKELFKASLRANPYNEDARFNYELISKMLEQDQQQQDQQQDQDQQQQDQEQQQEQQENQNDQQQQDQEQQQSGEDQPQEDQSGEKEEQESEQQEGEPKDGQEQNPQQPQEENQDQQQPQQRPTDPSQLEDMKISEEKAKMILEAMKNAEVQYIQQNQRKATKRPDSGKPDW